MIFYNADDNIFQCLVLESYSVVDVSLRKLIDHALIKFNNFSRAEYAIPLLKVQLCQSTLSKITCSVHLLFYKCNGSVHNNNGYLRCLINNLLFHRPVYIYYSLGMFMIRCYICMGYHSCRAEQTCKKDWNWLNITAV